MVIETLIHIDAPHFRAGAVVRDGVVRDAADVIGYMHGWSLDHLRWYCQRKHWTIVHETEVTLN